MKCRIVEAGRGRWLSAAATEAQGRRLTSCNILLSARFNFQFTGCPILRQPPREIVTLGPYTLHDYCLRVRNSASTGILDLTGVPVKRLPAAALHAESLHTLLLADSLIEVVRLINQQFMFFNSIRCCPLH
jgi:hypothetical protein